MSVSLATVSTVHSRSSINSWTNVGEAGMAPQPSPPGQTAASCAQRSQGSLAPAEGSSPELDWVQVSAHP